MCTYVLILKLFAKFQEATRKDVKRAFGVLQARWGIIKGPARMWQPSALHLMMNCCIILHNMIIENEGEDAHLLEHFVRPPPLLERPGNRMGQFLAHRTNYQDRAAHFELRNNLIEHIWARFGSDHVGSDDLDEDDSD